MLRKGLTTHCMCVQLLRGSISPLVVLYGTNAGCAMKLEQPEAMFTTAPPPPPAALPPLRCIARSAYLRPHAYLQHAANSLGWLRQAASSLKAGERAAHEPWKAQKLRQVVIAQPESRTRPHPLTLVPNAASH